MNEIARLLVTRFRVEHAAYHPLGEKSSSSADLVLGTEALELPIDLVIV